MRRSQGNPRRRRFALTGSTLLLCLGAFGQQRGQYLPETNGFNSGIQPETGVTYSNLSTFFDAVRLQDSTGNPVRVNGGFNPDVNQNVFVYVTHVAILGGNLGFPSDLPLVNGTLTALTMVLTGGGAGVDFEPFDTGTDVPPALPAVHAPVFAPGPEVDFLRPKRWINLLIPYEPGFDVEARTEGRAITPGCISYCDTHGPPRIASVQVWDWVHACIFTDGVTS